MIIEIESYKGDTLLFGPKCTLRELRKRTKELLDRASEEEFIDLFCSIYSYEILAYDNLVKSDYVIDLDTHIVKDSD